MKLKEKYKKNNKNFYRIIKTNQKMTIKAIVNQI